jgi:hypothetical protein
MSLRMVATYVCEECHAGWNVQQDAPREALCCRWCGKLGKLRGVFGREPVRTPPRAPTARDGGGNRRRP